MIDRSVEVAKSCLLPPLKVKLGEQLITREHFGDLQPILQKNIRMLLDIFHANEAELLLVDLETLQFRVHLVLVLCEQSATTIFQVENETLLRALSTVKSRIFNQLIAEDPKLVEEVFNFYRKQFKKDDWKIHLGSVYGITEFCEQTYSLISATVEHANFLLAVGLNFLDHFEPEIQILALKIFNALLSSKSRELLKSLNIHEVILKEALKVTTKSAESDFVSQLWSCLFACMALKEPLDYTKWTVFDDLFEELMTRLGFESNKEISTIYLCWINNFLSPPNFEPSQLRQCVATGLHDESLTHLHTFLEYTSSTPNYRCFRWVKKLMLLLQNESFRLGGDKEAVLVHLYVGLLHNVVSSIVLISF